MTPFERNYIAIALLGLLLQIATVAKDFSHPIEAVPATTNVVQVEE